ncbi:hypothetical protein KKG83_05030 [Candidatus Micrarchaeota archaeon]|nr:hypothetical protein [Candidatus Micrarchaeota archaeon]MBU2476808.1 hypothetical protein [Candidatus Micrarchaeota archaeon]
MIKLEFEFNFFMQKPRKRKAVPDFSVRRAGPGSTMKVLIKGVPVNFRKVLALVSGSGKTRRQVSIEKQNLLKAVSGHSYERLIRSYHVPEYVGSKGHLTFKVKTVEEKGKETRLVLLLGSAVPEKISQQGHFSSLLKKFLTHVYAEYPFLVRSGNFFIHAQTSSDPANQPFLRFLYRKGFAVIDNAGEVSVLRKRLDLIEMRKLLGEKKMIEIFGEKAVKKMFAMPAEQKKLEAFNRSLKKAA